MVTVIALLTNVNKNYLKWILFMKLGSYWSCERKLPKDKHILITLDYCVNNVVNKFSDGERNQPPLDTSRILNVPKRFRRRLGHLLNLLCTLNLHSVSSGAGVFLVNFELNITLGLLMCFCLLELLLHKLNKNQILSK